MHDLNQVLEHCKSGSQYKQGFCSNSTQYGSRADSFFFFNFRQSGDVRSRMDFISLRIHCQCGVVSVSCFLTCSFDMFKYLLWVSLCSVWFIFGKCKMWFCDDWHVIWPCTAMSGKDPSLDVASLGVWSFLGSELSPKLHTNNWNIPLFSTCRYRLSLVMSEFRRVPRMENRCVRLICGAFYLVFEDFMRRFAFHSPPVQVQTSLRTVIPLNPQWLTDLRR